MSSNHVDRNLLFGFLALQNDFIAREELIAAVSVWLTDKSRPLDEILRDRKGIAEDEQQLIAALVRKHLQRHGEDSERSLAALSSVSGLRDDLKKLGDADVEATLRRVSSARRAEEPQFAQTLPPDGSAPISSRFRILRPHAEGGLGQVFVAQDQELNREVALKEIKLLRSDDPDSRARFVLEAEITGGLEHPGIVPVYGLGQYADGRPFYAMRFIRGDSLAEAADRFHAVGQASRLPGSYDSVEFRQLLGRFIDVCNAIEYAHSRGVLHRDLKPGNIMLGKYGETLVVDWGLAKAKGRDEQHLQSDEHSLQPRSGSGSVETLMGSAIGTPAYMSPEQAAGRLDQLGPASDVYSLGATLYYVLTGRTPFDKHDGIAAILRKVQAGDLHAPREIKPQVPSSLNAICLKAMRREPHDRYASPLALAVNIERFLADEPVAACAEPRLVRARRWLRKHPRSVAAVAATLLVGIASAVAISTVVSTKNQQLAHTNASLTDVNTKLTDANAAQRAATAAERRTKDEAEIRQKEAELARNEEQQARQQAETAKRELAAEADRSKHALYARTVSLAHQEWIAGNIARATDLINGIDAVERGWEWSYVHRLCETDATILRGIEGTVSHVAMTVDGRHVIGVSSDDNIFVWRREDRSIVAKHSGRGIVSADGSQVAMFAATQQPRLRILDSVSGKLVASIASGTQLGAFSRIGKRFAMVSSNQNVRVFDIGDDRPVADILEKGRKRQHTVALDAEGKRIAWRRMDDGVLEWRDVERYEEPLHTVELGPANNDFPPRFSPDGRLLAQPIHRQIALYEVTTGRSLGLLSGHIWDVLSCEFAPDSRRLVSSSRDGTIRVWDTQTLRPLLVLRGHRVGQTYGVFAVNFDSTGNWIVSGGADGTVRVWDAWAGDADPQQPLEHPLDSDRWSRSPLSQDIDWLTGHDYSLWDIATSADGKWLATASADGTARVVPVDALPAPPRTSVRTFTHAPNRGLSAVALSSDGALVATGSGGPNDITPGEVRIWKTETGELMQTLTALKGPVARLAFVEGDTRLMIAVGSEVTSAGALLSWHFSDGLVAWSAKGIHGAVCDVAVEPRGKWVASVGHDGQAQLWDVATGTLLRTIGREGRVYVSVAISPDGERIALGGRDWGVTLLDANSGQELWSQRNHSGAVFDLCFSADGSRLFSTSIDSTSKVWDAKYGDETLTLRSFGGMNIALALTANQELLVARTDPEIAVYRPGRQQGAGGDNWKLVFSDAFERTEVGEQWKVRSGKWSIENGALRGILQGVLQGGGVQVHTCVLIPQFFAPSQVDISFDAWTPDPLVGAIGLSDFSEREGMGTVLVGKTATPFNNSEKGISIWRQSSGLKRVLSSRNQGFAFEPERRYRFRMVRLGEQLQCWLDGSLFLEADVSSQLAFPLVELQASLGRADSTIHIDNFEIRVPESATSEIAALEALAAALESHRSTVLAIHSLAARADLSDEVRELAVNIARQRLKSPSDELSPLKRWAAASEADSKLAEAALAWLDDEAWMEDQQLEVERVRAMLLYRAGQSSKAFDVGRRVAPRYRSQHGAYHPEDMAVLSLSAPGAGEPEAAKKLAANLRELLRCTRWSSETIDAWLGQVRAAGLLSDETPSDETELLKLSWELKRTMYEDSNPEPLIAALMDDGLMVCGRNAQSGEYDLSRDKSAFAATERIWHRGKPSPAARLVRELADVSVTGDHARIEARLAWITPDSVLRHTERSDWKRVGGLWRLQRERSWPTGFKYPTGTWDVADEGWEKLDQAVEQAQQKQPQRTNALGDAFRIREQFEEARLRAEVNAQDAASQALAAGCGLWVGDAAAMESLARKAVQLKPDIQTFPFIRAIATETHLADTSLNVLGKTMRVPSWYTPLNLEQLTGVPGKKLAAWLIDKQSIVFIVAVPKEPPAQNLDELQQFLTVRYVPAYNAQLVRARKTKFHDRECLDFTIEGAEQGLPLLQV